MTMKKLIFLLAILSLPGWINLNAQDVAYSGQTKVEVYYFHATMRCPTCLAVEEQTRKTLDDNFAEDLKSGTIKLTVLNLEEKENKAITEQFEIGWSSLILYVPESKKTVNLTDDAFANARSHPEEFRAELEKEIESLVDGL
jgi:hypothetical protein